MSLQNITLVSFGYFEKNLLEKVLEAVRNEFHGQVNLREGHIDLSEHYDPPRRQYNANSLIHQVDNLTFYDATKVLGLFNVDLYIPILTFIFGQAFLNGRSGIASHFRLGNERYGMPANDHLLAERFSKEVIHELGHMHGLIHCHQPSCVMRSSTYVEDIDQKSMHFCQICRKEQGIKDD